MLQRHCINAGVLAQYLDSSLARDSRGHQGLSSTAGGSKEADKHVRAAIKTALTPAALATSDGNKPHNFQLNYCTQSGVDLLDSFATTARDMGSASSCVLDPIVWGQGCLCAIWPRGQMDTELDMKIMAEPAEHESAAKEVLEGD